MEAPPAPLLAGRVLFESASLRIGHVVARPRSEDPIEVDAPRENALALPLAGLFARHVASRRPSIANANHGVFFPAGQPYRVSFPGCVGDEALTLQWSDDALAAALPGAAVPQSQVLLAPGAILRRGLLWRRLARGEADALELEELGVGLLASSLRAFDAARRRRVRPGGRDRVERVKEAVAAAPDHKWSLAELAQLARLSQFHLARMFREEVGIPVHAYVLRARLSKALGALIDSDAGITEVALDAGFSSHSHFTARFREVFGITPARVRRGEGLRPRELRKIVTAR